MTKLTKRTVDAADVRERDYFIWDDELPGFGLRVFASGKRSYLMLISSLAGTGVVELATPVRKPCHFLVMRIGHRASHLVHHAILIALLVCAEAISAF
ncbi:hypothetical protein [Reyranella sp.]|uniref:hypothetical protein n=1 Tax=Reyranella sp. TaxID=1929291 RepID=UPI003783E217